MSKSLYNFFIDPEDKAAAKLVLNEIYGEPCKGMIAAYLRVCIKKLIKGEIDKKTFDEVRAEYEEANHS